MGSIFQRLSAMPSLLRTFSVVDFFDIIIMSFIIYQATRLIRETRAFQLVKGLLVLVLAYFIALQLKFHMLSGLLSKIFEYSILVLIVLFQPEIRRALEQIGRTKLKSWGIGANFGDPLSNSMAQEHSLEETLRAIESFSCTKTGALIVFERETKLGDITATGTIVNAQASAAILENIFFNKAPLHDGAVVIRDGKIFAAGCILPLSKNETIDTELGTRHRAAIGISEISDALAVVVSEETGSISFAMNGRIQRHLTLKTLQEKLQTALNAESGEVDLKKHIRNSILRIKKNEKK